MSEPREDPASHRDQVDDGAATDPASSDPASSDPASSDPESELEPAFDIDLDPEDQGTAEAAAETSG